MPIAMPGLVLEVGMPAKSPKLPDRPLVVSVARAMELTGLCRNKIYESLGSGELQSVKNGRRRLINYASLEKMVGAGERPQSLST
jgi:excisionase family DNA binding protein